MRILYNFGKNSKLSLTCSHLILCLLLTDFLITEACIPKITGRSKKAGAGSTNTKQDKNSNSTNNGTDVEETKATGPNTAVTNVTNENEVREKRQLFREDIPEHRPLTGNIYALHHGFPHPGRFNDERTNSIGQDEGTGFVPYNPEPGFVSHALTYQVEEPAELTGEAYKTVSHGNEIVHQYPVEISQIIQLDGLKSQAHEPPKVHPDQDPGPSPLGHQIKPHEPADLIVREPNGEPQLIEEPLPHFPAYPQEYVPYAHSYGYHPNPYRLLGPYSGAYKIAHFFKNWPHIVRKMWPRRRYRSKIKHLHHHYV